MTETVEFDKNYRHLLWSGVSSAVSRRLVSPSMVLPFLYLALGAPQAVAGLLLPLVTAARLISEIFISPYIGRADRAIPYVLSTNVVTAVALSAIALFAASLATNLVAVLFICIALVLGLCIGVSSIGMSQVYGLAIDQTRRDRIVFVQAAIAGVFVIGIVLAGRVVLADDDPFDRHVVMLWIGIGAIIAACLTMLGTRLFAELEADEEQAPAETPQKENTPESSSPLQSLVRGFRTGISLSWFRRFVVARWLFLSVELAMPFYTIHASTYHLSTKHSLSTFVIAAAGGGTIGAIVWRVVIRQSMVAPMVLGSAVAAASAILALTLDLTGHAQNLWAYAIVIFLLAFGSGGVINGRYVYLIGMAESTERPYLVALGDVAAGLVGIVFAAALGWLAHIQDERFPLFVLAILNTGALSFALLLVRPKVHENLERHLHTSPDHETSPG